MSDRNPGREAAARHGRLTMEEFLKENKRMELNFERTEGVDTADTL